MRRAGLNYCKLCLQAGVNSCSIPTSCNAAMRGQNRAICPVAQLTRWVRPPSGKKPYRNQQAMSVDERSTEVSRMMHDAGIGWFWDTAGAAHTSRASSQCAPSTCCAFGLALFSPNIPQANDFNAFVSALMRRSRWPQAYVTSEHCHVALRAT